MVNQRTESESGTWQTLVPLMPLLLVWGFSFLSVSQIYNYSSLLCNSDVDVYWQKLLSKHWGLSYWAFKVVSPIFNTLWNAIYFDVSHQGFELQKSHQFKGGNEKAENIHLANTQKEVDPPVLRSFVIHKSWRADTAEIQV